MLAVARGKNDIIIYNTEIALSGILLTCLSLCIWNTSTYIYIEYKCIYYLRVSLLVVKSSRQENHITVSYRQTS